MKEIRLNTGEVTLVDDDDYEYLSQWRWCAVRDGNTTYACRYINEKNKYPILIRMHRIIMNAPKRQEIDHIDHNGLNNQRSNLRFCTHQQNQANQRFKRKYKYVGVFMSPDGLFGARIGANGQKYYLGYYKTIEEAAKAYNEASLRFHGENAYVNKI